MIPALSDKYHVIAPDYPGFGNSAQPAMDKFAYTFDNLSLVIEKLLEKKNLLHRTNDYKPSVELSKEGFNLVEVILPKWEKTMDELHSMIGDHGFKQISNLENVLK